MTTNETVALVTGGNKGIGREIVRQLAEQGMTVLLGARDEHRREQAAKELQADGLDVRPIAIDVTDQSTVEAAAARVDTEFGRLDVLVNNAGISGDFSKSPSTADLADVGKVFDTNVFGILRVTNALLPLIRRSAAGRIVNVSSGVGSLAGMSEPDGEFARLPASAGYVPSKTAVNSLTVQYAKELRGTPILVNAADPGYCATDLNGHQGFRTPAQGAAIAVRLATLGADGPSGGHFNDDGPVRW